MFKTFLRVFAIAGSIWIATGAVAAGETVRGVGFGDSLMAGYQLAPGDAFPARLEAALRADGYAVSIANAGVSGDTTSGGLARLDWSIPEDTDFVILELGANDALRGISPEITRQNIEKMIVQLRARGIDVILAGMQAPPNMGSDYAAAFNPIYPEMAEKYELPFYPFFLDGVIGDGSKLLDDGMHPNTDGVSEMAERMAPVVKTYLDREQSEG
ncbi:arylesterase [Oricola cellulosilytica]|uniref:Arylesterase n=1 Tax=Oricola cellulosilytica TaxID=1429082 RepID=A0A4R0P9P0_9HYPH|nr:arylesterase [Oricola cellulosilytica]TCD13871.1 arylesterase [Oricola cellulosilytica]